MVKSVHCTNYREIRSALIMTPNRQVWWTPGEQFYNCNQPQFIVEKLLIHAVSDLLYLRVREFCSC